MRDQLRSVDDDQRSCLARRRRHIGDRRNGSENVRHPRHGDDFRVLLQKASIRVEVQSEFSSEWNEIEHRSGSLGHHLPGDQIGVVLHVCEQDPIALAQVSASPSRGHHVEARCRAPREDDLFGAGVEKSAEPNPGSLVAFSRFHRKPVGAAVDVGVEGPGELGHGIDHDLRFQGRSCRVEEVACPGRKRREIGTVGSGQALSSAPPAADESLRSHRFRAGLRPRVPPTRPGGRRGECGRSAGVM